MTKNFRLWMITAAAGAISLVFSSCANDPYYTSVGGSYRSGYGQGYGYGGSNFSTSLFISTGDPRWGYDPHCHSYYDYRSHRYYDPYLYGYYPVGYRPQIVVGAPHPHGWRPGRSYCPPPRTVRNVTVVNYQHRDYAYRNSNYSWAKQVRSRPSPQSDSHYQNQPNYRDRSDYSNRSRSDRPTSSRRTPYSNPTPSPYSRSAAPPDRSWSRQREPEAESIAPSRSRTYQPRTIQPNSGTQRGNRLPQNYNTPVAEPQRHQPQRRAQDPQPRIEPARQAPAPAEGRSPDRNPQPQPGSERGNKDHNRGDSNPDSGRSRGMRSLGQG